MRIVNRAAFVVKPTEVYGEWANGIADEDDGIKFDPETMDQSIVVLAPEGEGDEAAWKWLQKNYAKIFEEQLEGWVVDEDEWPEKRDYKMFIEWFDVKLIDLVFDLGKEELQSE